ncbi:PREDICTED: MAGUK p55 subfamily member 5-like [Priapulus caudatus]|uniref:MAGUK p55 subfamily member 5-like n=1 Tax=Priapulus caudatus TaxID=37621 RepID=A0ABM1ETS4_PRICU|nr:PREDICTED: MAGUK p55 subfamily member 5-like [Priapulus caudatus]
MKPSTLEEAESALDRKKHTMLCAKRGSKKKKKVLYNAHYSEDFDAEEMVNYERVALFFPKPSHRRPLVMVGPHSIGRHELRRRLLESNKERFAAAVPHTSRSRRDDETDGVHYHFVARHAFEADIVLHRFVEHGEYEKQYYGTSLSSIRQLVREVKTCVLNLMPQALKLLKASDLKPYVIFIAPPCIEKLKILRQKMGMCTKDDDLRFTIEEGRQIEENFGHYFDKVIVNSDINRAYAETLREMERIELEPQWVPYVWMHRS